MKAVHVGYDHRSDDIRIVRKECTSLARNGIETVFITTKQEKCEDLSRENLKIIEVPGHWIRYSRLRHFIKYLTKDRKKYVACLNNIYDEAVRENPDIIHIHELELLNTGFRIKRKTGAKIIYDIHEDYPRQRENDVVGRSSICKFISRILAFRLEIEENKKARKCDYLICATEHITERFLSINPQIITITNYPIFDTSYYPEYNEKSKDFCYFGTINRARGIPQMVEAFRTIDAKLFLGGSIPEAYKEELQKLDGWDKVNVLGYVSKIEVDNISRKCLAGMLTILPTGNYYYSVPNKLFEYMSNGIPVIASDFPTFREVINNNMCGICVDPQDPERIQDAVLYFLNHPEDGKIMGLRGFQAVKEKYNWTVEEKKLIKIYDNIMK